MGTRLGEGLVYLRPDVQKKKMGALLARFLGAYYLKKVSHDSTVLHYRRTPTWRSLALFIGGLKYMYCNFTTVTSSDSQTC